MTEAGVPGGAGAAARTRVELPGVPGLAGLSARGVAASARLAALARLGRVTVALPDVEYVAADVAVDPDHLTAYQHLLGETASDALPAGFVHVVAFPVATALMVRDDFPLPLAGMVHLTNRVDQRRALRLGERLTVRAHAERLRPHRSGTRVDLVTEVGAGGSDDVVWRGVSTYLARGVRLPLAPGSAGAAAGPGGDPSGTGAETSGSRGDTSVPGGSAEAAGEPASRRGLVPPTPTGRWSLAADTGRRYAAVSGDRNPIHLSAPTARPFGFRRAIAHGMYTASRALADVGPRRGEAFTWTAEFARPVLLPGTVSVRVAPRGDGPGVGYAVWDPRSGSPHLTGAVVPG